MLQNLSSAAVIIGALRAKAPCGLTIMADLDLVCLSLCMLGKFSCMYCGLLTIFFN